MNPSLSIELYKQLINGHAVNKHQYHIGEKQNNPLFDELFCSIESYRAHYGLMGFELVMLGDSFFLRESDLNDQYKDAAMRIQVIFEILARGMALIPLLPDAIMDYQTGLAAAEIRDMAEQEDVQEILKACGMKDLSSEVENNLVRRGLAVWNLDQALVLSDCGVALFNDLFTK